MKIKVWCRITEAGDGSSFVNLYPTEAKAKEGLDEDLFELDEEGESWSEYPVEIEWEYLDITDCEVVE